MFCDGEETCSEEVVTKGRLREISLGIIPQAGPDMDSRGMARNTV